MRSYFVDLDIRPEELARYYGGRAGVVLAVAATGERVQFPAASLRPFVTHDGVQGACRLEVDGQRRLKRVVRLK